MVANSELEKTLLKRIIETIKPDAAAILVNGGGSIAASHGMGDEPDLANLELVERIVSSGRPESESNSEQSVLGVPYFDSSHDVKGIMYIVLQSPRRLKHRDLAVLQELRKRVEKKLGRPEAEPTAELEKQGWEEAKSSAKMSLKIIARVLRPERAAVLIDIDGGVRPLAALGITEEELRDPATLSPSLLEHLWQQGSPSFLLDASKELDPELFPDVAPRGIKSVASCPLTGDDGVIRGLVYLESRTETGRFRVPQLSILSRFIDTLRNEIAWLINAPDLDPADEDQADDPLVGSLKLADSDSCEEPLEIRDEPASEHREEPAPLSPQESLASATNISKDEASETSEATVEQPPTPPDAVQNVGRRQASIPPFARKQQLDSSQEASIDPVSEDDALALFPELDESDSQYYKTAEPEAEPSPLPESIQTDDRAIEEVHDSEIEQTFLTLLSQEKARLADTAPAVTEPFEETPPAPQEVSEEPAVEPDEDPETTYIDVPENPTELTWGVLEEEPSQPPQSDAPLYVDVPEKASEPTLETDLDSQRAGGEQDFEPIDDPFEDFEQPDLQTQEAPVESEMVSLSTDFTPQAEATEAYTLPSEADLEPIEAEALVQDPEIHELQSEPFETAPVASEPSESLPVEPAPVASEPSETAPFDVAPVESESFEPELLEPETLGAFEPAEQTPQFLEPADLPEPEAEPEPEPVPEPVPYREEVSDSHQDPESPTQETPFQAEPFETGQEPTLQGSQEEPDLQTQEAPVESEMVSLSTDFTPQAEATEAYTLPSEADLEPVEAEALVQDPEIHEFESEPFEAASVASDLLESEPSESLPVEPAPVASVPTESEFSESASLESDPFENSSIESASYENLSFEKASFENASFEIEPFEPEPLEPETLGAFEPAEQTPHLLESADLPEPEAEPEPVPYREEVSDSHQDPESPTQETPFQAEPFETGQEPTLQGSQEEADLQTQEAPVESEMVSLSTDFTPQAEPTEAYTLPSEADLDPVEAEALVQDPEIHEFESEPFEAASVASDLLESEPSESLPVEAAPVASVPTESEFSESASLESDPAEGASPEATAFESAPAEETEYEPLAEAEEPTTSHGEAAEYDHESDVVTLETTSALSDDHELFNEDQVSDPEPTQEDDVKAVESVPSIQSVREPERELEQPQPTSDPPESTSASQRPQSQEQPFEKKAITLAAAAGTALALRPKPHLIPAPEDNLKKLNLWQRLLRAIWPKSDPEKDTQNRFATVLISGKITLDSPAKDDSPIEVTLFFEEQNTSVSITIPKGQSEYSYHAGFVNECPSYFGLRVQKNGFFPVQLSQVRITAQEDGFHSEVSEITLLSE